jgi:deoxyribodipyrimidine photo-lyase
MDTAIVLFTRDLRLHDNPALAAACARARQVVPLFVVDPALTVPPNQARFLADSLAVLWEELRERGADLVIRKGDPVAETIRLATRRAAQAVFVAGDVSRYAARREQRLAGDCGRHRVALEVTPGHAVVPAGDLRPAGGDGHYRIFTPYWRAWRAPPGGSPARRPRPSPFPRASSLATYPSRIGVPQQASCLTVSGRAGTGLPPGWTDR